MRRKTLGAGVPGVDVLQGRSRSPCHLAAEAVRGPVAWVRRCLPGRHRLVGALVPRRTRPVATPFVLARPPAAEFPERRGAGRAVRVTVQDLCPSARQDRLGSKHAFEPRGDEPITSEAPETPTTQSADSRYLPWLDGMSRTSAWKVSLRPIDSAAAGSVPTVLRPRRSCWCRPCCRPDGRRGARGRATAVAEQHLGSRPVSTETAEAPLARVRAGGVGPHPPRPGAAHPGRALALGRVRHGRDPLGAVHQPTSLMESSACRK